MSKWNFLPVAFLRDKFLPFEQANISVATHALHYGTAAFGGLRGAINPDNSKEILLFRLDSHAKRLSKSAKYLNYNISSQKIIKTITEFVRQNRPIKSFYIRPLVYNSTLGIVPKIQDDSDLLIYGLELDDYLPAEGVRCSIASWYRQEDRSLPLRGKISGTYITSCLAKTEAISRGFDEAILMNTQGKVSEASGMNLFIVRDGQLITPGVEQDILEGITRDSIIQIARDEFDLKVVERPVDKTELVIADEIFLSGTAAKITPIKQIEQFELPKARPITEKLKQKLVEITLGQNSKYESWIKHVQL